MLARRNALQQIIALVAAPAIIRVAPLMPIKPASEKLEIDTELDELRAPVERPQFKYRVEEHEARLVVVRNATNEVVWITRAVHDRTQNPTAPIPVFIIFRRASPTSHPHRTADRCIPDAAGDDARQNERLQHD